MQLYTVDTRNFLCTKRTKWNCMFACVFQMELWLLHWIYSIDLIVFKTMKYICNNNFSGLKSSCPLPFFKRINGLAIWFVTLIVPFKWAIFEVGIIFTRFHTTYNLPILLHMSIYTFIFILIVFKWNWEIFSRFSFVHFFLEFCPPIFVYNHSWPKL